MSLKNVVEKLHKCVKESEERGEIVLLELDNKPLAEVVIDCVSKKDFTTRKNRDRNVSALTEKETAMILEKSVGVEKLERIVLSILKARTEEAKESKDVIGSVSASFYCGMSQEALERADRKR